MPPCGCGYSQARAGGHVNDDAGFVAEFGRGRARDDFHGLDGIQRNLVGEDLALLVGNGLAVDREGILGVVAETVKQTVGVGGDAWGRQRHQ